MEDFTLLCISIDGDDFNVHVKTDAHTLEFQVCPVREWTGVNDSKGRSYIDKENESDLLDKFEPSKCLIKMEGSFCWRGVWEGRLYFTDDEYWGEDIEILSKLYNNHIVPWCKEFIKNREPGCYYDD
jgi:hypothetical protein